MSVIPKGWTCTRVLVSGPMPYVNARLPTPVDVVFARVVSATLPADVQILAIDCLNHNEVSAVSDNGKLFSFSYNYFHSGNLSDVSLVFPDGNCRATRLNTLQVRALGFDSLPSLVAGTIVAEIELWNYSA
jgi:hypothetical protein